MSHISVLCVSAYRIAEVSKTRVLQAVTGNYLLCHDNNTVMHSLLILWRCS